MKIGFASNPYAKKGIAFGATEKQKEAWKKLQQNKDGGEPPKVEPRKESTETQKEAWKKLKNQ